jgi:hypothetical protein
MKQSRVMSFVESAINILVGFGISLTAQMVFLPMIGVPINHTQNFIFAGIMTVISFARSYLLRRIFEFLHIRTPLSPFMQAVIAERRRQVEVEGWDDAHDSEHEIGELATAGAAYARKAALHLNVTVGYVGNAAFYCPNEWPWSQEWWKPTGFRRDLVKAAALILAEGEKFDRARKPRTLRIHSEYSETFEQIRQQIRGNPPRIPDVFP